MIVFPISRYQWNSKTFAVFVVGKSVRGIWLRPEPEIISGHVLFVLVTFFDAVETTNDEVPVKNTNNKCKKKKNVNCSNPRRNMRMIYPTLWRYSKYLFFILFPNIIVQFRTYHITRWYWYLNKHEVWRTVK